MSTHLHIVDGSSSAGHGAVTRAFAWAVDVLGLLPDEERQLIRSSRPGPFAGGMDVAAMQTMLQVVAIAEDVQALIDGEDEIREWLRLPNRRLWSGVPSSRTTTPLGVMLSHPDGVRAIRIQTHLRRYGTVNGPQVVRHAAEVARS